MSFTKINSNGSKCKTGLNVKHKTVELLEDNIEENLDNLESDDDILHTTPKPRSMKEIIDKLDFIKIKFFCSVKDNVKRMRRQATDWEKILAKDISDKELLSKHTKNS